MGKDSLIKSTTKKKTKKAESPKKTTAKKKTPKTAPKKSPKKAAKSKASKSVAKKRSTTKTAPKKAPKKAISAAKPKSKKSARKLTVKELLLKSFDPISKVAKPQSMTRPKTRTPSAPPFTSASDPKEVERIRGLLLKVHSMENVKTAAKAPVVEPSPAAVKPQKTETVTQDKAPKATQAGAPEPIEAPMITAQGPPAVTAGDPISAAAKYLALGLGVVILLVLMVSYNNSAKYYILPKDKSVEIRKGRFSPKDNRFFMVLHGTQLTGKSKNVYSKNEIYPLIFSYYLDKADTLLEIPGLPDFDGIKSYLHDAKKYAVDDKTSKSVSIRLNNIERMILLYKADVAISKNTVGSLKTALKHLKSAQKMITDPAQEQEIQQKLSLAASRMAALEAKAAKKGK